MSSTEKQQNEALQLLVHEKQEEIDQLKRQIDVLVRAIVRSGRAMLGALEDAKNIEKEWTESKSREEKG